MCYTFVYLCMQIYQVNGWVGVISPWHFVLVCSCESLCGSLRLLFPGTWFNSQGKCFATDNSKADYPWSSHFCWLFVMPFVLIVQCINNLMSSFSLKFNIKNIKTFFSPKECESNILYSFYFISKNQNKKSLYFMLNSKKPKIVTMQKFQSFREHSKY